MAPQHDLHKMVGRKLTKKRKPLRASSVQYPARLREGEDAQEDVTAAKGEPAHHMNQSVFSMIAAAGSKVDFNARFEEEEEEESSDTDDESQASPIIGDVEEHSNHPQTRTKVHEKHEDNLPTGKSSRPWVESVEHRGLRSLPKPDLRTIEEQTYMSQSLRMPSSEDLHQHGSLTGVTPRDAPVMSMMLEAQAELIPSTSPIEIGDICAEDSHLAVGEDVPTGLTVRLMEIFGFEKPEVVVSGSWKRYPEYPPAR